MTNIKFLTKSYKELAVCVARVSFCETAQEARELAITCMKQVLSFSAEAESEKEDKALCQE